METVSRRASLLVALSLALAAPRLAQSIRLSPPGEHVPSWSVAADGKSVLFAVDGGTPRLRLRGLAPRGPALAVDDSANDAGFPGSAGLSPDGRRVVYRNASDAVIGYRDIELFSQPLDGSAPPVRLNGPLAPDGDVAWFAITPDSTRVVYAAGELAGPGLFVAPIDGSAAASRVDSPSIHAWRRFVPDSSRLVFGTHDLSSGLYEAWSVPLDGSAPAARLGGARTTSDAPAVLVGSRAVYRASFGPDHAAKVELLSAPLDASAPATRVNSPLPTGGNVERFALTPDRSRAAYIADQEANFRDEVFVAPVDGGAAPVKISGPFGAGFPRARLGGDAWIQADDTHACWRGYLGADDMLLRAPLDGSAPPTVLYAYRNNRDVDPLLAGERLVFQETLPITGIAQLWSMPLDGSAAPVRLNGPLVAGGSVGSFQVAGENVFYVADQDVDQARELFAAPIDGTCAPVRVSVALAAGRTAQALHVLPGGERVVYMANASQPSVQELFLARLPFDRAR